MLRRALDEIRDSPKHQGLDVRTGRLPIEWLKGLSRSEIIAGLGRGFDCKPFDCHRDCEVELDGACQECSGVVCAIEVPLYYSGITYCGSVRATYLGIGFDKDDRCTWALLWSEAD